MDRAKVYEKQEKYELALEDLTAIIKNNPKSIEAYDARAIIFLKLNRYTEAKRDKEFSRELKESGCNQAESGMGKSRIPPIKWTLG